MKGKISFSHLEKEFMHEMRNKINNSESKSDLMNHFSYTIISFLEKVFMDDDIDLRTDDIQFDPYAEGYFKVSNLLREQNIFKEAWDCSDLPNVISRFAGSTYHRYIHLGKHLEKTERKIRN